MKDSVRLVLPLTIATLAVVSPSGGCGGPSAQRAATQTATSKAAPAASERKQAKLVVAVILDQLPAWAFEKYRPYLPDDGLLARAAKQGAHYTVEFPYAGTYTAPGHATVYSGVTPRHHGITSNRVWDREEKRVVATGSDPDFPGLDREASSASPKALRAKTVADALHEATDGRAHIVSISLKLRGAVLPGGQHADAVFWYDPELPGFTTSSFYAKELPPWFAQWREQHPPKAMMQTWNALDPDRYRQLLGPDDAEGEGNYFGLGTTFPHDPSRSEHPYRAVRATPMSTGYLLQLVEAAIEAHDMGEDDVPDLLALSVSGTDYIGHYFGGDSWEYLDNLIRVDAALGQFADRLAKGKAVSFVITSDHGGAPLPERVQKEGKPAGRILQQKLVQQLDAHLDNVLGDGNWVVAFEPPLVHLSDAALQEGRRAKAIAAAIDKLQKIEGIEAAYSVEEARAWAASSDRLRRAAALSLHEQTQGEIFVVPARYYVVSPDLPQPRGTSHGGPWDFDQQVPLLLWGHGVRAGSEQDAKEAIPVTRVAPSIAHLLGGLPLEAAQGVPVPAVN